MNKLDRTRGYIATVVIHPDTRGAFWRLQLAQPHIRHWLKPNRFIRGAYDCEVYRQ